MILQALARYYDIMQRDPNTAIAPPGYCTTGVSFALNIGENGELLDVFPLFEQVTRGNKTVETPRRMVVPEQTIRSSSIVPNFLWDNATYVLGISDKVGKDPAYAMMRFEAFREFNRNLLLQTNSVAGKAVLAFLEQYDPLTGRTHPAIAPHLDGLLKGGNVVFMFKNKFVHDDPAIRRVWEARISNNNEAIVGQCLITGERAPIAILHTKLKRVRGAQPTGASLVGFNERAYESYNRVKGQGLNAPVSEQAEFAYTTALNYLLSSDNPNPPIILGDTTIVYWAESEKRVYPDLFAGIFDAGYADADERGQQARKSAEELLGKVAEKVQRAQPLDMAGILRESEADPSVSFYVLGLAPNAARISVRFFINEPFVEIVTRMMQHYQDLQIVKGFENQRDYLPLRAILGETVSQKAQNPEPAPLLAGSVMRAILSGAPYPAALFSAIITRVRADADDAQKKISKINYARAAVIKAFLLRKYRRLAHNPFKEVLIMSLNEQSKIPAYVLGRLFAELERVQQAAIGSMNASIKDRYFTSACATPASVFPVLLRLSQHHIAKAEYGRVSDKAIESLLNLLDIENNPLPAHLSLDEQGVFILGYYHQRAAFYTKKETSTVESIQTENPENR